MSTAFSKDKAREALANFKEYFDNGLIEQDEYEQYKQEILNLMTTGMLSTKTLRKPKQDFDSQMDEIFGPLAFNAQVEEILSNKMPPQQKPQTKTIPSVITQTPSTSVSAPVQPVVQKPLAPALDLSCVATLTGHGSYVTALAAAHGKLFTASADNSIKVWDLATLKFVKTLEGHSHPVSSIFITPKYLISGSWDTTLRLWDIKTFELVDVLKGHNGFISSLAFDGNSTLYSGGYDCTIQIWDLNTRKLVSSILKENEAGRLNGGHSGPITSIFYANDRLVSGSHDNTVKLWNKENACKLTLQGHKDWVLCVTVFGRYIASGSRDNTVRIWEFATGRPITVLEDHKNYVYSLAVSSNGKYLYSGSMDKSVKIWDLTQFIPLQTLYGHINTVCCILPGHGNTIFTSSWDKLVKIWQ